MNNILSWIPLSMSAVRIFTNLFAMLGLVGLVLVWFRIIPDSIDFLFFILFLIGRMTYKEKELEELTETNKEQRVS